MRFGSLLRIGTLRTSSCPSDDLKPAPPDLPPPRPPLPSPSPTSGEDEDITIPGESL